jgi:hypothetical protein
MLFHVAVRSPFLRKAIEHRGIADDRVTSLLIVERYLRHPEPTNSIVALMLKAIDQIFLSKPLSSAARPNWAGHLLS